MYGCIYTHTLLIMVDTTRKRPNTITLFTYNNFYTLYQYHIGIY
jgi:hypothetical protein